MIKFFMLIPFLKTFELTFTSSVERCFFTLHSSLKKLFVLHLTLSFSDEVHTPCALEIPTTICLHGYPRQA